MTTTDPADRRLFLVTDDEWDQLQEALDRPAEVKPRLAELLANACACGDCYHPVIGPNTDGEPCDWCRDCACPGADHNRMTYVHDEGQS